jgi:hypothetical protein
VIVTAMDNLGTPSLRADFGVDVPRIMTLHKRHNFRLQVEDPQSEWSRDPGRYLPLAERYRAIAPNPDDVMVDLNILQFRNEKTPTPFPTLIQTGVESYELVRSAAFGAMRYTIYSESSVRPQDLRMFSYAASARAAIARIPGGWEIDAPYPVVLRLPQEYTELTMDAGIHIYPTDAGFLLPAGEHEVKSMLEAAGPFSGHPVGGNLLSISGDLLRVETSNRSVTLKYSSTGRCAATFSHRPIAVLIDGQETALDISQGVRRFGLLLPPGEHNVTAVLESTVTYGIDITSFWSSWLIVGFGLLAVSALVLLYVIVRVSRPSEATA